MREFMLYLMCGVCISTGVLAKNPGPGAIYPQIPYVWHYHTLIWDVFDEDGLSTIHNHQFVNNPEFAAAYARGYQALHPGDGIYGRWRVKVALWAGAQAAGLEGDFVECGVNRGFLSSAIMQYLDWNTQNRHFYLFDTFYGLDADQVSEEEMGRYMRDKDAYSECYEQTKENFSEFHNVSMIKGVIPYSLEEVNISKIAYLSIDLNCAKPEVAALEFFWPKLVKGAIVLLDDYAFWGYEPQYHAMNQFAKTMGIEILPLPTGQGLIIKQ